MPEAEVAVAEAASTTTKAASIETRLMERGTERMTEAAPAEWGSEPAPARPKSVSRSVSRRPMRREAAAVTGRRHGPTATCVTLSLRWNQEHRERHNG